VVGFSATSLDCAAEKIIELLYLFIVTSFAI
jgi:hypothetical protein